MPRNEDRTPAFKCLLPRRRSDVLKFFTEPRLCDLYDESLSFLEYQHSTGDEVAVRMTTRELQLCWVIQNMRRENQEIYEFNCRGLDEMESKFITPAIEKEFDRAEDDAYSDDDDDSDESDEGESVSKVKKRRGRKRLTPAMRTEVVKMTNAGKSAAEIAKVLGISLPSVMNIKKQMNAN